MRMTVALILLLAATSHAEPELATVPDLIKGLQSADESVRKEAAGKIAKQGYQTIEKIGRQTASLDAAGWQALADACVRKDWYPDACALVAAAHAAPEEHRRRLIELAQRLDGEAGESRTPEQISAIVFKMLVLERGMSSDYFYAAPIAIHGHAGVPAVLKLLREKDEDTVDYDRTSDVLELIAQPEDVPALRALLLQGKSCVAFALARLRALDVIAAGDALIDAVLAGRFDQRISMALPGWTLDGVAVGTLYDRHEADLHEASYRRRAAAAVRKWAADPDRTVGDPERLLVAAALGDLDSREDVPALEEWISSTRSQSTRLELGRVLTRLGSPRGIELLVGIAEGKAAADAEEVEPWQRRTALEYLNDVVVAASPTDEGDTRKRRKRGPWGRWFNEQALDEVRVEVRAWWEAARERLTFDEVTGRWRFEG